MAAQVVRRLWVGRDGGDGVGVGCEVTRWCGDDGWSERDVGGSVWCGGRLVVGDLAGAAVGGAREAREEERWT
ncbi:hypothetical protein Tco_0327823 [Tanacetum coccineum]